MIFCFIILLLDLAFSHAFAGVSAEKTISQPIPDLNNIRIHMTINYSNPLGSLSHIDKKDVSAQLLLIYPKILPAKFTGRLILLKRELVCKTGGNFSHPAPWIALIPPDTACESGRIRLQELFLRINALGIILVDNTVKSISSSTKDFAEKKRIALWLSREHLPDLNLLGNSSLVVNASFVVNPFPSDHFINRTSVLFVSISFILLMIISLAWLVFYYIQRFRYIHAKERLSRRLVNAAKKALGKIPVRVFRAGDPEVDNEYEQCAVCIEPYRVSDTVRVLPCKHFFHKSCIDPWLLDQRSCPMCKVDILKACGVHVNGPSNAGGGVDDVEAAGGGSRAGEPTNEGRVGILSGSSPFPLTGGGGGDSWTAGVGQAGDAFLELRRTSLSSVDVYPSVGGGKERNSHSGRFGAVYEINHVIPVPANQETEMNATGLPVKRRRSAYHVIGGRYPDTSNCADEVAMSSSEEWTPVRGDNGDPSNSHRHPASTDGGGPNEPPNNCYEVVEARLERRPSFSHSTTSSTGVGGGIHGDTAGGEEEEATCISPLVPLSPDDVVRDTI